MLFRHDSAENLVFFCGFFKLLLFCREKQTRITEMTSKQTGGNTTAGLRRQEKE